MKNTVITTVAALAIGLILGNMSRKNSAMAEATRSVLATQQIDFTEVAIETNSGTRFGKVLCVRTEGEDGSVTAEKKSDISDSPNNIGRLIGTVNGQPVTIVVEW